MPRETIDRLTGLDIPVEFIHGNGDRVVRVAMTGVEPAEVPAPFRDIILWTASQLDSTHATVLSTWPSTLRVHIAGIGNVLFCHATPQNDTDIFTRLTPEDRVLPMFDGVDADLVVCGHTHMQFERRIGTVRVVNAGSVGMPFGEPGAYWLLLGPDVELRRTSYDLARAAELVRATAYPQAEEFASKNILQPPSEATMLAAFTK
jgi:predicted phosphodiesterase